MTSDKEDENEKTNPVRFIPASNRLQRKAPTTVKSLEEILREADKLIAGKQEDYLDWVREDVKALEKAFQELSTTPESKEAIKAVFDISHKMMGLGGTFDYPLVTNVLRNLGRFLEDTEQLDSTSLQVAGLHVFAIKEIVSQRLSGDGGKMGKELLRGLVKATEKQA